MSTARVWNIAHRGARSLAPENTLLAARKAYDLGADMWETDIGMTRDGALIILHDDTLTRTTNVMEEFPDRYPWRVSDFTLAELRALDAGSWYPATDPYGLIKEGQISAREVEGFYGLVIPTLEEALSLTRELGWSVNLEIKNMHNNPAQWSGIEEIAGWIRRMAMQDQVIVSSFNHSYLPRIREILPELRTAVLVDKHIPDPVNLLRTLGAVSFNPSRDIVTREMVYELREAGFGTLVWTVNDPSDIRMMMELGVKGIFTDFPQILCELQGPAQS